MTHSVPENMFLSWYVSLVKPNQKQTFLKRKNLPSIDTGEGSCGHLNLSQQTCWNITMLISKWILVGDRVASGDKKTGQWKTIIGMIHTNSFYLKYCYQCHMLINMHEFNLKTKLEVIVCKGTKNSKNSMDIFKRYTTWMAQVLMPQNYDLQNTHTMVVDYIVCISTAILKV